MGSLRVCGCLKHLKPRSSFTVGHATWFPSATFPPFARHSHQIASKQWEGKYADPVQLTRDELSTLHDDIKDTLKPTNKHLYEGTHYYFDGQGKMFRPMTVNLVGKVCNQLVGCDGLTESQRRIMMISEMIHTSSLLHDDVIDSASTRRNKPSINQLYTHKQSIFAGNYILSQASILLAEIGSTKAVDYFSRILDELVRGELMQLVAGDATSERFEHYIQKTYRKTAALIAYSCRIVALLGESSDNVQENAFNYGKNIGIAFQLVDDALDFVATSEQLGKAAGADMTLGLATAPVLFAAEKYPDLHALIGRKFKKEGDVAKALELVHQSDGIEETFMLAKNYANEAVINLDTFGDSMEKCALINLCNLVLKRTR